MRTDQELHDQAVARIDHSTLFVSLELSRSKWLVTSLSPGSERLSKHFIAGGDAAALLLLLERLRGKAEAAGGGLIKVVAIQEAGLDGFWLHRLLLAHGIESHVVDAASIAVPRRHRRAKSDKIDGEMLLRTLLAYKRGERRVCAMVVAPSPREEERRRLARERESLLKERISLTNRIKGLLFSQGIADYNPLRRDRRARLASLSTGDGRLLPPCFKAEIARALDRIELLVAQIAAAEAERDAMMQSEAGENPAAMLMKLKGVGPAFASVLCLEGLYRHFGNRRQLAAYCGLAPSPWRSGKIAREQGISKAGNKRLRKAMIELAWLWLRHQPGSALSRWFEQYVGDRQGRFRRVAIVALARKLLVALWRYATQGLVPEGAILKTA